MARQREHSRLVDPRFDSHNVTSVAEMDFDCPNCGKRLTVRDESSVEDKILSDPNSGEQRTVIIDDGWLIHSCDVPAVDA